MGGRQHRQSLLSHSCLIKKNRCSPRPAALTSQVYGESDRGDRCPRKHLSHRSDPPTCSDPVHRYGAPCSPQPPGSKWGGGLLTFQALGERSGRCSWGAVSCGVTLPSGFSSSKMVPWQVGDGVRGGQPGTQGTGPACRSHAGRRQGGPVQRGCAEGSGQPQPQLAGPPRPGAPSTAPWKAGSGGSTLTLGGRGCLWPKKPL